MLVVKTDAQGNPIKDEHGNYVFENVPDPLTQEQISAQIQEAARSAATATRAELEAAQRQREQEMEAQLRQREEEARRAALATLPPDQQVVERLRMLEESNRILAQQRIEDARIHGEQIRQMGLVAYRERALRDVPEEVALLVDGNSEDEIDAAQQRALEAHNRIVAATEARLRAEFEAGQRGALPGAPPTVQHVPVVVSQPRTPHVVAPPPPDGGYPSVNNGVNPPAPGTEEVSIPEMTTEEAVRSGKYGGEMRKQILARVQNGGRYIGQLGAQPRHWSQQQAQAQPVPHTTLPDGVQQPTGLPTPPAQNPQVQQPSAADLRAAALAANNAARAGDAETQQYQQSRRGGPASPQQVFSGRFANTPPVNPGAPS